MPLFLCLYPLYSPDGDDEILQDDMAVKAARIPFFYNRNSERRYGDVTNGKRGEVFNRLKSSRPLFKIRLISLKFFNFNN